MVVKGKENKIYVYGKKAYETKRAAAQNFAPPPQLYKFMRLKRYGHFVAVLFFNFDYREVTPYFFCLF